MFKERASLVEPPVKLTFGVSPSLDHDKEGTLEDAVGGSNVKEESVPDYSDTDFYLPLPGSPTLSSLDPMRTDKLMLRGNRAKGSNSGYVVIYLWDT